MANRKQLKLLKQDAKAWNEWIEAHPDEKIDLPEADDYYKGADLQGADLRFAKLATANLTGALLFAAAKDYWTIDGIRCDYVFWDESPGFKTDKKRQQWEAEHRVPKDRDFRPGEFEELYKQLPTFEYVFEHGFTAFDAVLMDRIVAAINEQHPEFELKLDSFQSRGQPHATFTVLHKEQVEIAQQQVTTDYEQRFAMIEGKQAQMLEFMAKIASDPKIMYQYQISGGTFMSANQQIIGNNFESGGGNQNIAFDQATANQTNNTLTPPFSIAEFQQLLTDIQQKLAQLAISEDAKAEALNEVNGAEMQAKKPTPDKAKIADKLKNAGNALKEAGALGAEAVSLGTAIGKAILWCGEHWTF